MLQYVTIYGVKLVTGIYQPALFFFIDVRAKCRALFGKSCHKNARCSKSGAKYKCSCKSGFVGDGFRCKGKFQRKK